ncbi:peptidylprolyl isomerase [Nocardioides sp. dk4132]|uniref:peptidylprolyl isomerase n=1 Tax=unclassified Nocardioides TaxID=2615069 RepID=UPI001296D135|nr:MULTISPECIES: peptidylprolyl isomerase [unclassified Nocardioides]MQW75208.1 peptidylprolyl isomerase [Nocardioides sp. dk4132]QGA07639.1 peptidylprolyl isomerase [Nocardioides sp. dk884]
MPAAALKRPLAALAALAVLGTLAACGDDEESPESAETSASPSESVSAAAGACEYVPDGTEDGPDLPAAEPEVSGQVKVSIATSAGDLSATLDADAAPCTVSSFVSLAEQGYFDETPCHRLTTAGIYVLQCGDPTGSGMGGPGYTIPDEVTGEETYPAGTLAMANTGAPNSGGSQFFIVYQDANGGLAPSYTEFGTISKKSLAEVRAVAKDGVEGGGTDGPPATPVEITSVTVE